MSEHKLTFRDKQFCFKVKFKMALNQMYLLDKEFKNFIKSIKIFIWLSIIYLILNIIVVNIGYYL